MLGAWVLEHWNLPTEPEITGVNKAVLPSSDPAIYVSSGNFVSNLKIPSN